MNRTDRAVVRPYRPPRVRVSYESLRHPAATEPGSVKARQLDNMCNLIT